MLDELHREWSWITGHKANSSVDLDNSEVKHSRQGNGYVILLKCSTVIVTSKRKIDMD